MKVIINYEYYHASRDVGGSHYTPGYPASVPSYLEGQISPDFSVLVEYTHRTTDPYQDGDIVPLDQLIAIHAASGAKELGRDILITIEDPGLLNGLDAYVQSAKDAHYV